jgi:hypothetical protein
MTVFLSLNEGKAIVVIETDSEGDGGPNVKDMRNDKGNILRLAYCKAPGMIGYIGFANSVFWCSIK